jgi:hypothetical protein
MPQLYYGSQDLACVIIGKSLSLGNKSIVLRSRAFGKLRASIDTSGMYYITDELLYQYDKNVYLAAVCL